MPQIADIVAWLHVQTWAAGHRSTYAFQDVLTGDAKKGEAYFNTTCAGCHSATGDLKGIGSRYDAFSLQARWLQPRGARRGGGARRPRGGVAPAHGRAITVTVTPPSGHAGHRHAGSRRRFQRLAARRGRRVSFVSAGRRRRRRSRSAIRCVRTRDLLPQVHRRRYPQRDCLPGEPQMKIRTLLPHAPCSALAARRTGTRSGHAAASSRWMRGRPTTATTPAAASAR